MLVLPFAVVDVFALIVLRVCCMVHVWCVAGGQVRAHHGMLTQHHTFDKLCSDTQDA